MYGRNEKWKTHPFVNGFSCVFLHFTEVEEDEEEDDEDDDDDDDDDSTIYEFDSKMPKTRGSEDGKRSTTKRNAAGSSNFSNSSIATGDYLNLSLKVNFSRMFGILMPNFRAF